MLTLPTQPVSILKTWGYAIALYFTSLWRLLPITLLLATMLTITGLTAQTIPNYKTLSFSTVAFLIHATCNIIVIWLYTLLLQRSSKLFGLSNMTLREAILFTLRKLPTSFFGSLLFSLLISLTITLLFFLTVYQMKAQPSFIINPILLALIVLAVIATGLCLLVLFWPYLVLIIVEDKGLFSAFLESKRLVWHHWVRTFIVLLLPIIFLFSLFSLTNSVVSHETLFRIEPYFSVSHFLIASLVIDTLIIPFFVSVSLTLYHDLKLRRLLYEEENGL